MAGALTEGHMRAAPVTPWHVARRTLRHWPVFLAVLATGIAAGVPVVLRTEQVYRSEAVLLYRQTARVGSGEADSSRRAGSRLQDMLLSQERLRRIADEMRLYPQHADRNVAADEMRKRVMLHVRDGSTFLVTFDAADPAVAQAAIARLTQTLIRDNALQRVSEAEETRRLLDGEHQRLAQEVNKRETALTEFLRVHPEAALARSPAPDNRRELDTVQREFAGLRAGRLRADAPAGVTTRPDPDLLAIVRRAEQELATSRLELAEREQRLTDAHPDLMTARERARRAQADLLQARELAAPPLVIEPARPSANGGPSSPARYATDMAGAEMASLEQEITRLRRTGTGSGRRINRHALRVEVELEGLRHDVEQARQQLASLEERQLQAAMVEKVAASGALGQLALLDPASRPGLPLVDVRKKVALAALTVALMLAGGTALLRARADDRIFNDTDAEWMAGQSVLVTVPSTQGRPRRNHA